MAYPCHLGGCLREWNRCRFGCRANRGAFCAARGGVRTSRITPSKTDFSCAGRHQSNGFQQPGGEDDRCQINVSHISFSRVEERKSFLIGLSNLISKVDFSENSDIFIMRSAHISFLCLQWLTAEYYNMRIFLSNNVAKKQHDVLLKVNVRHTWASSLVRKVFQLTLLVRCYIDFTYVQNCLHINRGRHG